MLPWEIVHVISLYRWEQYALHDGVRTHKQITAYDSADAGTLGGLSVDEVISIATLVNECREDGPTLVHCQAGLNRSSLIAATALILNGDVSSGGEAIDLLRERRSPAVLCNPAFASWLQKYFDTVA